MSCCHFASPFDGNGKNEIVPPASINALYALAILVAPLEMRSSVSLSALLESSEVAKRP